jgi:1,4-dihydroxy-2-naphthoate octaprenyltransferase
MAQLRAWLQAARPLAFGNIALPLVFGAALATSATGRELHFGGLVWALVWGLLDQLSIVFWNDLADEALDRRQDEGTWVSGGSRVLAEGKLEPPQLRRAAWVASISLCGWSLLGSWSQGAWLLPSCALAALGLLWAYSFSPLRLSYRDGGAVLQALGMGLILPMVGWQLQGGSLGDLLSATVGPAPALVWFLPGFAMAWVGNWLTAIPDLQSDANGGKQTRPVRVGATRCAIEAMGLLALIAAGTGALLREWELAPRLLIGLALCLVLANRLRRDGPSLRFVVAMLAGTTYLWVLLIAGLLR